MQEVFTPIQQGSLKDVVYAKIRAAILSGTIAAGTRLLEAELAQTMQVSRAPLREALAHLEQEGLVVSRPNRGTYVAEIFSQQDIDELTTLRSTLETMAISIAAAKITTSELDTLADIVERMQHAAEADDLALLADLDYQFHSRLVKAAGHNRLYQMWSMLAAQFWALYLTGLQNLNRRTSDYLGDVRGQHMPIVDALRTDQTDLATISLQRNILSVIYGPQRVVLQEPDTLPDAGGIALRRTDKAARGAQA